MAKFYLTKKAVDDLAKIWDYTFHEWSEQQADKYYQMLIDNFIEISQSLETGKIIRTSQPHYLDEGLGNTSFFTGN